jgi:hypothetical protein
MEKPRLGKDPEMPSYEQVIKRLAQKIADMTTQEVIKDLRIEELEAELAKQPSEDEVSAVVEPSD